MDPIRSDARKFSGIVIVVVLVTLGLFEAIAHRGQGVDAPGVTSAGTASPSTPAVEAPGSR